MRWPADTEHAADSVPQYVIGFGAVLLLVLVGEVAVLVAVDSPTGTNGPFLVGVVTTIPFLAGIIIGGYWLRIADLSPSRYPRIVGWLLGGSLVFVCINLALIAAMPPDSWAVIVGWIRWAVALGAGVGLLIGCLEGRAIERSLAAERAVLRSEHLEDRREYLDYLNGILRHEVLNAATIIDGHATLLLDEEPLTEQGRRWVEIISDESADMATVIDDVRILLRTTEEEWCLEPVNLSRVLTDELRKLDNEWESVDIDASIPDDVSVRADGLVARLFGNLLSNAVEHNDAPVPTVSVTVDPGPETVRVEIADNGPGIPEAKLETLFDRVESYGSTHGLGLHLVHQLATRYDGTVELVETGPDGSTFAVELPRATSDRPNDRPIDRSASRS